ncbi:MAG: hypothetical protein D6718_02215, partial [Acidobacteria bacterium]
MAGAAPASCRKRRRDRGVTGGGPVGQRFTHLVEESEAGIRLDRFCAGRHPDWSRTRLARLIRDGRITVGGRPARPSRRLEAGET